MEMFWLRFVTFHNVAEKRKSKLLWKWQSSVETRFFADEFIKCQCCVAAPSWTNFRLNQCSQLFIANVNHFPKISSANFGRIGKNYYRKLWIRGHGFYIIILKKFLAKNIVKIAFYYGFYLRAASIKTFTVFLDSVIVS